MTTRSLLAACVLAVAVVCSIVSTGHTACNSPGPSYFDFMAHRTADVERIKATIPEGMPFRGDRGRVNVGVLPAPGSKDISFSTDPFCSDGSAKAAVGDESAIVIMVYSDSTKPQDFEAHAVTDAHCKALTTAWKAASPAAAALICNPDLKITSDAPDGATRYSFPRRAAVAALDDESLPAPFVTGVVIAVPKSGGDLVASMAKGAAVLGAAFSGERCTKLVSQDGVRVCVDTLYGDYRPGGRCLTTSSDVNFGHCTLYKITRKNFFDKNCRGPGCTKGDLATELHFDHQVSCEALAIPFDFQTVRLGKTKKLRGRSAVSRGTGEGERGPIVIPGDEFLASIPEGYDNKNPKAPDLKLPSGTFTDEVALQGSVDEDLSVVLLLPRALVSKVCPADDAKDAKEQACQTYEAKSLTLTCADAAKCTDRTPSYFYCESTKADYLFTGMPCTRPAHCKRGGKEGTCTGRPVCVPKGSVWTGRPLSTGDPCDTDDDKCDAQGKQCGYSLFDFSTRDRIARELVAGQIGSCVDAKGDTMGKCDANTPCPNDQTCEGYILFDDGEK